MIPLIETGGTPFEIGYDVGAAMKEQITAAASSTRADLARATDPRVMERIQAYVSTSEEAAPSLHEELRGMAEGSGVSVLEFFVMNAAAELYQETGFFEESCTVAGVTPAGAADGHVLIAHNEDATAGWADYTYLVRAQPTSGPAFAAFTYAGLLLHQGVNAAGIGSVGNALYAKDARPGVPKLLAYREILNQTTIEGAIRAATSPNRAFGNNHLIANDCGDIYDIEVTGGRWAMLDAGNRYLAHANHLVSPSMVDLDADEDLLNSRLRMARVERLIERQWGTIDLDRLAAIMSDHANYPGAVCKHHTPESDLEYGTIGCVVIDVTTRTLRACAGNPCRGEWREVTV
jgi:isopenicillin-N N-acyltransferase-like protein